MSDPLLTLLTAVIAAEAILGMLGLVWPQQAPRILWLATALAGVAALGAVLFLLAGALPATLTLPIGLPGADFRLTLDPLSAFFTALLFGAGAATCAASPPDTPNAPIPIALAALGLAVLGGGGLERAFGLALAGGAIWMLRPADRAGAVQLAVSLLAAATVAAAAGAPQPAVLWLALLGPGTLAGLAPLHAWLAPADAGAPAAGALLSGGAAPVAIYAMLRLLFDHPGGTLAPWWGLPLLLLGAGSVLAGGLDEARQPELDTALAGSTVRQTGVIAIGIGIALMARAADLPSVTAIALAAVLLLTALQAICGTLLALAAGGVRHGAGTRSLERLGGLVHSMPVTSACLLAGLFGLAALPPGAGFAAIWLLFHALLGLPHAGPLPLRLLMCALAAVLGVAAALGTASLLRLVGVVCLGRPRTARASAAEEQGRTARVALLGLAAGAGAWGLFVGPLLRLLADAPVRSLAGTGLGPAATWLGVASDAESPGYAALPLGALLMLLAGAALWARRRRAARVQGGAASSAAWNDGFAAPPGWLPFGDPLTQTTGVGFIAALPRLPRLPLCRVRLPDVPRVGAPAVALILVAVLLAVCAWAMAA